MNIRLVFLFLYFIISIQLPAQTFSGTGGSVPDNGPAVNFPVIVSGLVPSTIDTTFGLETVCLSITHTWDADLVIILIAPDGTHVDLSVSNGGDGDNYTNTCFDGLSTNFISSNGAPFTGTFRPQGFLGTVNNGQNGNGTWQLMVQDIAGQDTGSVVDWSIHFGNHPSHPFNFSSSNLPLVVINTNSHIIPDEPKINAHMGIIDNGSLVRNHLNDVFNGFDGNIGIELRGSSSQGFPQKSYGFQIQDTNGVEINQSLLGMPSESDWILYAPYDDKTLLRNVITYQLCREMGEYTSRTKFCELFINGQYKGIYVLMEKIKRDANRADIAKLRSVDTTGDELTGGYIFKVDKTTGSGSNGGWTSTFPPAVHPGGQTLFLQYDYPSGDSIVIQQKNYIQHYVDSFETALSFFSFNDLAHGYRHFINEPSFIDFFIMDEISKNVDGYRLSSYLHKDRDSRGGKLTAGPQWDFNLAWWNADYCAGNDSSGWAYRFGDVCPGDGFQVPFWWEKMMSDTLFREHLHCRWKWLRANTLDTTHIFSIIDSLTTMLQESQVRHFTAWPILGIYTWPNPSPLAATYSGEIDALKKWTRGRLAWLDDSIPSDGICPNINTSIQKAEQTNFGFTVFPNPFSGVLNISLGAPFNSETKLILRNVLGEELRTYFIRSGEMSAAFDLSNIPGGIYFLTISSGGKTQGRAVVKL